MRIFKRKLVSSHSDRAVERPSVALFLSLNSLPNDVPGESQLVTYLIVAHLAGKTDDPLTRRAFPLTVLFYVTACHIRAATDIIND